MNRFDDDGSKLPAAEQELRLIRHGEDWLDAHRNFYNIRNVPELQQYYNTVVSRPLMEVIHGFTALSEPLTKVQSRILVIVSDNISQGRGTFLHGFEMNAVCSTQRRRTGTPTMSDRPDIRSRTADLRPVTTMRPRRPHRHRRNHRPRPPQLPPPPAPEARAPSV